MGRNFPRVPGDKALSLSKTGKLIEERLRKHFRERVAM